MKKVLFFQALFTVIISIVITALAVICTCGIFVSVKDIPVSGTDFTFETALVKGQEVAYSTMDLTQVEMQNLLISAESDDMPFVHNNISYSVEQKSFSDGTKIIKLIPEINKKRIDYMLLIFSLLIFLLVYFLTAVSIQKRNNERIIEPLIRLKEQTHLLAEGKLDINITDDGLEEINRLGKEIESLRIRLKKEVYFNKKASENRRFLISSMSHDLRTPITALRGYLDGVIDGVADSKEKQKQYIKKALEKTTLINLMINDLLLYSKLDLNQIDFKYQHVNIADYLTSLTEENQLLFEREKKKLVFDNQLNKIYSVNIDIQQFDRVMSNIITNALKYIEPEKGLVKIILRENTASVIIEVADNGSGINEEDIPHIFDRFYRGEKSRQIKGSSGLGLAISKQIIDNMKGRIWAISREHKGTSILISLKKYAE